MNMFSFVKLLVFENECSFYDNFLFIQWKKIIIKVFLKNEHNACHELKKKNYPIKLRYKLMQDNAKKVKFLNMR